MPYAFAALLFLLSLATGIPAIPHFLRMRKIKQNRTATTGLVHLEGSSPGGLQTSFLGKVNYPQIFFRTPDDKEYIFEIVDSSNFKMYRYKSGESIDVVYDKNAPSFAYAKREWDNAVRDLWMCGTELLAAIILWNIGLALKIPI
jgi:hypothetical protein